MTTVSLLKEDNNMTTGAFTFRINEKLKKDATQLFESLGLSLSSAINIFLKQSVLKKNFLAL